MVNDDQYFALLTDVPEMGVLCEDWSTRTFTSAVWDAKKKIASPGQVRHAGKSVVLAGLAGTALLPRIMSKIATHGTC